MERCPHCGAEVREGAKFCTTCGQRFGNDSPEIAPPATGSESIQEYGPSEHDALADHAMAAWPTSRTADDAPVPAGWTWHPTPVPPALPEDPRADDEATAAPKGEDALATWGAAATGDTTTEPVSTATAAAEPFPTQVSVGTEPADTLDRVDQLLAELRQLVAGSPAREGRDLSGVIEELEIAITPPGAVPADELAGLREAIFAARERPRDLDTVVDLTSRISGLVALVIAYDRAVAAIERALAVLRAPDTASTA